MNNNIFDINRFGKLIKREWFNPKNFKFGSFVPAALPILFLLTSFLNQSLNYSADQRATYLSVAVIILILSAPFVYFNNFNHPKKGIIDTMLPASSLEKFLVMQLTGLIFAPLFIIITFGGVDTILSLLFPKVMSGYAVVAAVKNLDYNWEKVMIMFTIYQSMIFCNLWFRRNKILKTLGIYIVFGIVMSIIGVLLFKIFVADYSYMYTEHINISINGDGSSLMIKQGDHPAFIIIQLSRIFMNIVLPISLTIGSYFMLKTRRY